ncbi:hypothetical protein D3A96_08245 [Robertkochia marina]|nr:hypothetical protein D3A96_08245 [Robertkochia marina]
MRLCDYAVMRLCGYAVMRLCEIKIKNRLCEVCAANRGNLLELTTNLNLTKYKKPQSGFALQNSIAPAGSPGCRQAGSLKTATGCFLNARPSDQNPSGLRPAPLKKGER